jgi:hypothetical protein
VPQSLGSQRVVAKTSAYTLTERDIGTMLTNRGASGKVTFTLPTSAPELSGWSCEFYSGGGSADCHRQRRRGPHRQRGDAHGLHHDSTDGRPVHQGHLRRHRHAGDPESARDFDHQAPDLGDLIALRFADDVGQVTITEQNIQLARGLGTSPTEEAWRRQDHVLDVRATDMGLLVTFTDRSTTIVVWSQD